MLLEFKRLDADAQIGLNKFANKSFISAMYEKRFEVDGKIEEPLFWLWKLFDDEFYVSNESKKFISFID